MVIDDIITRKLVQNGVLTSLYDAKSMILGSGATDLLIEWEDMFPYWGPIANISAKWVTMNVTINMTMTIIMTKTVARKDISHFFCSRNSYTKAEVSSLLQVPVENLYPFHMLLIHRLRRKMTWE